MDTVTGQQEIENKNLGVEGIPSICELIEVGQIGEILGDRPDDDASMYFRPQRYCQCFKAGNGCAANGMTAFSCDYLDGHITERKGTCIQLEKVGGFNISAVIDCLDVDVIPVPLESADPHLDISGDG